MSHRVCCHRKTDILNLYSAQGLVRPLEINKSGEDIMREKIKGKRERGRWR